MTIYQTRDVFTPTTPARVGFIERLRVNDRLVNALTTPGKQVVVYGHSGSGKTTLLVNKLTQLYERHLTSRCMKGVPFEQLILDGFDQLAPFYTSERSTGKKTFNEVSLSASYSAIRANLQTSHSSESGQKEIRILPPQLTPQALGRFMGEAKCCWILEDFHKVDDSEKVKLSQLMKIFMDLSDEFPSLRIVALGAVDTARQVIDYDPEMRLRVSEIHVDLMTVEEIESVIAKGEEALNITFGPEVKSLIAKYSNGLASVCHHLCLNMCDAAGITRTSSTRFAMTRAHFESAIAIYVEEASDSIRSAFDKALRVRRKTTYHGPELVLQALSSFKERGASRSELHNRIRRTASGYPVASLKNCLTKLITEEYGGIVRFDPNSGLYSFSDPIHRAFALANFREPEKSRTDTDFSQFLKLLTSELLKQFPRGLEIGPRPPHFD